MIPFDFLQILKWVGFSNQTTESGWFFSQMMVKSKGSVPKKCWKVMLVKEFCFICPGLRKFLLKAWGKKSLLRWL